MAIDVFISHHVKSSLHITQAICNSLEANGVKCWYAPRDTQGAYASNIVDAIDACKVFILVLNHESSFSQDVLNEINLVFERVRAGENVAIIPFHTSDDGEISKDAKYYIGRMHWIDAITPPMEERINELTYKVNSLIGNQTNTMAKMVTNASLESLIPLPNYNFIGRDEELQEIHSMLQSGRVLFVYGLGGSGKTEIVKKYIHIYKENYDAIVYTSYESSLQDMIISDKFFCFEEIHRKKEGCIETDEDFARRKLLEIKKRSTKNTLIVIDNFDTKEDSLLEDIMNGPYNLIFTTRTNFEDIGLPMLAINSLKVEEQKQLFFQNYKREVEPEEKYLVSEIIKLVNGHTLTIELIAKLMFNKRIKPHRMLEQLKEVGISPNIDGNIKYGLKKADTIYSHIRIIFNTEALSEKETYILKNLALLPISGIAVEDFADWCEIEDYEDIDSLANRSWIKYDVKNDAISLHPVIADVVKNEYNVDFDSCGIMIENLVKGFNATWSISPKHRKKYGEIAKSLYIKNPIVKYEYISIYKGILRAFYNMDYFELSKELLSKLEEVIGASDLEELGAFYYEKGDFELRCMNYENAVEELKKSIAVYSRVSPNSYKHGYVTKHLAHIYHAIYKHKDKSEVYLLKAQECLKQSEAIIKSCADENSSIMGSQYYAYALNRYYNGDYETALEYAYKSYGIFLKINGEVHSDTTAPMWVLALTLSKLGRFEDAIDMQERVIEIREKLWGTNQFKYFEQIEILAEIFYENGRINEAKEALTKVLELIGDKEEVYRLYVDKIRNKIMSYK